MKKIVVLFVLLLFSTTFVYAQDKSVEGFAEAAGEGLLKVQEFFLGALSFLSFGAFSKGGTFAIAQFLFIILFFMLVYSIATLIPFITKNVQLPVALTVTLLAFLYIDAATIEAMLISYESMGIAITFVIPILILFTFTFRIYQRAYEGKSEKSPFYVRLFNMIFLVFFGVFFIRYSLSEEGVIAMARLWSGWILISLGVAQFLFLYKVFAIVISKMKKDYAKEEREKKADIRKQAEEIDKAKAEAAESLSKKSNES